MPSSINYEEATEKEIMWLIDQLRMKHFDTAVLSGKRIVFARGRWTEIFAVDGKSFNIYESSKRRPYSMGLLIGELKRELKPSLSIAKYCENQMHIKDSQVNSITYGKDPEQEVKGLLEGDFFVFVNNHGEALGYGKIKKGKARNTRDLGWYIREGK